MNRRAGVVTDGDRRDAKTSFEGGVRPKIPDAALTFGQLIHQALAQFFRTADPAASFDNAWLVLRDEPRTYGRYESREILRAKGGPCLRSS